MTARHLVGAVLEILGHEPAGLIAIQPKDGVEQVGQGLLAIEGLTDHPHEAGVGVLGLLPGGDYDAHVELDQLAQ